MSEPSINRGFGRELKPGKVVQKCYFCPTYTLSEISHDGHIICYNCENKRLNRKDHVEKNIQESGGSTPARVPGGVGIENDYREEGALLARTPENKKAPIQKPVLGKVGIYTSNRLLAR